MSQRAQPPALPAGRDSRHYSLGRSFTSPAIACHMRTSTRRGSRSAPVSQASVSLLCGEVRSIPPRLVEWQARPLTSSTFSRCYAPVEESSFTTALAGTAPGLFPSTCSLLWPVGSSLRSRCASSHWRHRRDDGAPATAAAIAITLAEASTAPLLTLRGSSLSPAQSVEAAPRLLRGAGAEVGSERTGEPTFGCVQLAGDD